MNANTGTVHTSTESTVKLNYFAVTHRSPFPERRYFSDAEKCCLLAIHIDQSQNLLSIRVYLVQLTRAAFTTMAKLAH